jgi:hypothetical protein
MSKKLCAMIAITGPEKVFTIKNISECFPLMALTRDEIFQSSNPSNHAYFLKSLNRRLHGVSP